MRPIHLVALLAITPACIIESRNVNVGQVNRPSVPFTTGAPPNGIAALSAGASSMPTVTTPKNTNNTSGAEVPDTQIRGELIFRPTKRFFIGAVYEQGLGHQRVDQTLPELRTGNVSGAGLILGGTLAADPSSPFSMGINVTLMRWSVPYDQYTTATFDFAGILTGVSQYQTHDVDSTGTIGVGLWPSYTFGQARVFGGGYVTQRPTVHLFTKDTTVIGPVSSHEEEEVIGNEAIDLVLAAGIEVSLAKELSFSAIINQEVLGATMRTGPSLQLAVTVRLGEHKADRKPSQDPPPVYAPGPYAPAPAPAPYAPPPPAPLPPPPPM